MLVNNPSWSSHGMLYLLRFAAVIEREYLCPNSDAGLIIGESFYSMEGTTRPGDYQILTNAALMHAGYNPSDFSYYD